MPKIPLRDWVTDPDILLSAYQESLQRNTPEASLSYPYPLHSFTRSLSGVTMIMQVNSMYILISLNPVEGDKWQASYWTQILSEATWQDSPALPLIVQQATEPPLYSVRITRNVSQRPLPVITYTSKTGSPVEVDSPLTRSARNVLHEVVMHAVLLSRRNDYACLLSVTDNIIIDQRKLLQTLTNTYSFTLEGTWHNVPFFFTYESGWSNDASFSFLIHPATLEVKKTRGFGVSAVLFQEEIQPRNPSLESSSVLSYRTIEKKLGLPQGLLRSMLMRETRQTCSLTGEYLAVLFLLLANETLELRDTEGKRLLPDAFREQFTAYPPYDALLTHHLPETATTQKRDANAVP